MLATKAQDYPRLTDRGCKPVRHRYGPGVTCLDCPRFPLPCLLDYEKTRDYDARRRRETPKAVRMLRRGAPQHKVAAAIGCSEKTLRRWVRLYGGRK